MWRVRDGWKKPEEVSDEGGLEREGGWGEEEDQEKGLR